MCVKERERVFQCDQVEVRRGSTENPTHMMRSVEGTLMMNSFDGRPLY